MKNTRLLLTFLMTVGCWSAGASLPSAQPGERQLTGTWSAQWICDGGSSPYDYGVYRFRKRLDLPKKPERFVINISADNRYRLLVNVRGIQSEPFSFRLKVILMLHICLL